ncbi:antibiotic acetyltransferase [Stutzerimonas nosocomialis]|uniref:Antibiotic acetyltransferase n=1 Tax=Stutzerimonas nosocomialis TaxID=1056496 RepID=A0A5R9QHW8_9GAMM|nr:CatB-related O-acetyltransferase [Stutzerimonas nosocomialis]TLX55234.1 antibiotic acetyltransferase [Stutzerimonas nosocomialis]TLX58030.1 antibiotic acetyltransferase [Stutzerimonas nosocomialis]TLX64512.1 antibiotic acetyltransferase [Stutzerimonas nosocomialis]
MGWFSRRKKKQIKQRIKEDLSRFEQGPALFRFRYPDYEIGEGSYGVPDVRDFGDGSTLRIGSYTSIAADVRILLGGNHRVDWLSSFPFPAMFEEVSHIDYNGTRGDVIIGSDVWLCTGCMVLSGITIGHGAVVAAGAIVTRDVEPYSIVAGNPARHMRWRFDAEHRDALLASQWWSWPEREIRSVAKLLCSTDMTAFTEYVARRGQ